MPHLHLGILRPRRLLKRTAASERAQTAAAVDPPRDASRDRPIDGLDRIDPGASARIRPAAKKVAFAAEPTLMPPTNFRMSAEWLTPTGHKHPLDYVKSSLRLAASGQALSETTLDVLDALVVQHGANNELLTLRIIANRCAHNSSLCIQDCERILEYDPHHRIALLHRAAAWLDIDARHRHSIKNRAQAELAAQAWITQHPSDIFGVFLSATAVGNHATREVTEASLGTLFENDPKHLKRGQLLYAFQCKMYSYHPSQELFDRIGVTARTLKEIDSGNLTTLRLLGYISEVGFDDALDISTRQFLKWPLLQQDPELDQLLKITSPAESL